MWPALLNEVLFPLIMVNYPTVTVNLNNQHKMLMEIVKYQIYLCV